MKNSSLQISEFKESDRKALQELFLKVRKETFVWKDQTSFHLEDFDKETQGEYILTAFFENRPIGFISVWVPNKFIHHLYIDSEFQKRGIGKSLLEAIVNEIGYPLRLKCLEKNTLAISFYKKLGFTEKEKGGFGNDSYILFQLNTTSE
ncbi:GNAT family N-acetyltransferase [Flavobacterium hungaricum]|uniref:N-acetyltransferase n=1 Tax=Flavobacterium hungaricum TaxID=2082725 RepID=A0ABR9TS02_9FLAO|nr:GNAT family N-acetyltransferase [Flavobacterium hungaricum]MBE8728156.1 N-acetyltransferase [Flavobacterium hungaricum]